MAHTTHLQYDYVGTQGRSHYFEGWYLKFSFGQRTIALIPSLHTHRDSTTGNLQWIVSENNQIVSANQRFNEAETHIAISPFRLKLGACEVTEKSVSISVDTFQFAAQFTNIEPYPSNIMGPFRHLKRLPCIHGLQATAGTAQIKTTNPLFRYQGMARIYCEKDRGTTFPERYLWLHCEFPEEQASLFFAIAKVPIGPVTIDGFIANFNQLGTNSTFATYYLSHCHVEQLEDGSVIGVLRNRSHLLRFTLQPGRAVWLDSPRNGRMQDQIQESMDAIITLTIHDKQTGDIQRFDSKRCTYELDHWFD